VVWCEGLKSPYAVTPYVAEFWNTVSSIPIAFFGLCGIVLGHRNVKFKTSFILGYALLGLVGIGSAFFHATNRYFAQLLDELPMLFADVVLLYCILEHEPKPRFPKLVGFLTAVTIAETAIYMLLPSLYLVFFSIYGLVVLVIVYLSIQSVYYKSTFGSLIPKRLMIMASILYWVGFALWVTENLFCLQLPGWAHFHAVWHILAGLGTYTWIQFVAAIHVLHDKSTPKLLFWSPREWCNDTVAPSSGSRASAPGKGGGEGGVSVGMPYIVVER